MAKKRHNKNSFKRTEKFCRHKDLRSLIRSGHYKRHTFSIKKLYVVKLFSTTTFFLASPNFDFTPSFTTWTATFARISVTVFGTGVITANVAIALLPLLIFKTSLT
ncbi:unnamed protein product [Rhizophagus irregularis]|nr:unnamed protein product [Rhizophagus irregularis]